MTALLLWLAVGACAQQDTLPVEDMDKEGSIQAVQKALDDKFSVVGGTLTGPVYISSAIYVQGVSITASNSSVVTSTGANSITGSITLAAGSTLTVNSSAICTGVLCVVGSSEPIQTSSLSFTLPSLSSGTYKLIANGYFSADAFAEVYFNHQIASLYNYGGRETLTNGTVADISSSNPDTKCRAGGGTSVESNIGFSLAYEFTVSYSTNANALGHVNFSYQRSDSTTIWGHYSGTCHYKGTPITAIDFKPSTGNFIGKVELWRYN